MQPVQRPPPALTVDSSAHRAPAARPVLSVPSTPLQFTSFVKTHGKTYTSDEFFPRYSIFKANVNKIRSVN